MIDLIIMVILSREACIFFDDVNDAIMKYISITVVNAIGIADILHIWGVW